MKIMKNTNIQEYVKPNHPLQPIPPDPPLPLLLLPGPRPLLQSPSNLQTRPIGPNHTVDLETEYATYQETLEATGRS